MGCRSNLFPEANSDCVSETSMIRGMIECHSKLADLKPIPKRLF